MVEILATFHRIQAMLVPLYKKNISAKKPRLQ